MSISTTQPLAMIDPEWFQFRVGCRFGPIMSAAIDHTPPTGETGIGGSGTSMDPGAYVITSSGYSEVPPFSLSVIAA